MYWYVIYAFCFVAVITASIEDNKVEPSLHAKSVCKDTVNYCDELSQFCNIDEYKEILGNRCQKTCGYCYGDDSCEDSILLNCKAMKRLCTYDVERMNQLCPITCGACRVNAPPKCAGSPFGCCWDKETTKYDEVGSNCPECYDEYKNACKTFIKDCNNLNRPGEFMRRFCRKSCKLCNDNCKDDPDIAYYCSFWKMQLDWCESNPSVMQHYCPKTCGYC